MSSCARVGTRGPSFVFFLFALMIWLAPISVSAKQAEMQEDADQRGAICPTETLLKLRERARNEERSAQYELAMLLDEGNCPQNKSGEAMDWLRRAAKAQHKEASYLLAEIMLHSHTGKAAVLAFELFEQAAVQGHMMAQHRLGVLHLRGAKSAADFDEGFYWLGSAAAAGHGLSAAALGMIHARGMYGVPRDLCLAMDWYRTAQTLRFKGMEDFIAAFVKQHEKFCL